MSLYKRDKIWYFDFWRNGKRFQGSTKQTNINKAREVEAKLKTDVTMQGFGIGPEKESPFFKDFMETRFVDHVSRHSKAKRTAAFYRDKTRQILKYEPWLTLRLNAIDADKLDAYTTFRLRKVQAGTVNLELATLRKALRLAEEWKLIRKAPKVRLLPGVKGRTFVVSPDLEREFLAVAPYPLKQAAILMLDLGLRPEECVRLKKSDVSGCALTVREGKSNNAARALPLTQRASCQIDELSALWPDSEFLFRGSKGSHLQRGSLDNAFTKFRDLNEWPAEFVLYSFRHTYGTRLAESGANVFHIKALMGHSSIKVSERYIHPSADGLELAAKRAEMFSKMLRGESTEVTENLPTDAPERLNRR